MWPDRVSNPGPLTYESGALLTAQRGPADLQFSHRHLHDKRYSISRGSNRYARIDVRFPDKNDKLVKTR